MQGFFEHKLSKVLLLFFLFVAGCIRHAPAPGRGNEKALRTEPLFKVGLVLDKGGKDDKSFNSAAFAGATKAAIELGIRLKTVESPDDTAYEPALRAFAERGFGLVIGIGFAQTDSIKKVALAFPKTHFAIVDGVVKADNVASLTFAEHEGSFMVGYLAGLASKTGTVGFIGGMDIPMIRRFQMGYEAGVKAAKAQTKVLVNYVGINSTAWTNPGRGKELALGQYDRSADIIFHAAGLSGMGLFDAAEEKQSFAIGVDSDQNCVKPGRVLSSMLKRVDVAVFEAIKAGVANHFLQGARVFGLADKGVDYSVDSCNQKLIAPYQEKLEEMRSKIIKGEIKVPDYYTSNKVQ